MILAIDLGTTNFKAAVFDEALARLGEASAAAPYITNDAMRVEMDAGEVWATLVELIAQTCKLAGTHTTNIQSVAITSQAQSFTIMDDHGRARTAVISWLDKRGAAGPEGLSEALSRGWHEHCSFPALTAQMQLAHLMRLRAQAPRVLEEPGRVVPLPALIFERLGGVSLCDDNLAAMSGMYSLWAGAWREEALAACGLKPQQMPRLVSVGSGVPVAELNPSLPLGAGARLVSAGNDQTAGALGNGCRGGEVVVTLGTALVAYRFAGQHRGPYSPGGCWGPYPGGGYYELAFRDEGCLALDWAAETLMPGSLAATLIEAAARGQTAVTVESGFFVPGRMRTSQAWTGDLPTPDLKAYAVLEGLAMSLRQLVRDELTCSSGTVVRAIGGGSRSAVWLQIIADVLDCPVHRGSGDSLLGAALMAAGRSADVSGGEVFHPRLAKRSLLDERFDRWRKATDILGTETTARSKLRR
ncbi:MAG: FGGY-family carbohydrate kinase [Planctomycetaceae bacterium]|nr:FGGY-family carbohydrate kinase [Planctomycetaceae bacterium]